jgi:nitronate monooxygenase
MFNTALPIIQAPMAGVQGSALAIAVSNAGGLGSLPCAMLSMDAMRDELTRITSQSDKPYNVNFFCHTPPAPQATRNEAWRDALLPHYAQCGLQVDGVAGAGRTPFSAEHADVLAHFKPPVVSFHFGLPSSDLLERVRSWGSKIISSATTVEEAKWLASQGVDAVIAQGVEAGGHRGIFIKSNRDHTSVLDPCFELDKQMGTFALLPQIVRAVTVPVIAAGGIADASGVRAAMALGASAVQIGTAYLLCVEATTSKVHRAALLGSLSGIDPQVTALTNLFTGRPARGIVNRLMREMGSINRAAPEFPLATAAIAPLRAWAEAQGLGDFSPLWAGQNTSGCKAIAAADLTRELAQGL